MSTQHTPIRGKLGRLLLGGAVLVGVVAVGWLLWRAQVTYRGQGVRAWAVQSLSTNAAQSAQARTAFSTMGTNAIPHLVTLLQGTNTNWREKLWARAATLPAGLRSLAQRVAEKPDSVRVHEAAARSLGYFGPEAEAAIPPLASALRDPAGRVRWEAAQSLGRIGKNAVPALTNMLHDPDVWTRQTAASALGEIGPDAADAIPALSEHMDDWIVTGIAVDAMARIGPAALPAAFELYGSTNANVRLMAARLLGALQLAQQKAGAVTGQTNVASPMLKGLVTALHDPAVNVRLEAGRMLEQIGAGVKPIAAELEACRSAEANQQVREMVGRALSMLPEPEEE